MPAAVPAAERRRGVAAIGAVTLLWALNFVAAHPVAAAVDPFVTTFVRAVIAALVFVPAAALAGGAPGLLAKGNLKAGLLPAASCIVGNQVLFLVATRLTTPAHVAVVIATIPVFVALLSHLVLRERLARWRLAGIGVAFLGVVLLALQRGGAGTVRPTALGDAMALLAAVCFAVFTVSNKTLVGRLGAFPATAVVYLVGSVLMLPLAALAVARAGLPRLGRAEALSAAYLVVASTLLAYPLFSFALARLTASRVAVFTYLQPIGAASASYLLGLETFSAGTAAAGALAILGVLLAQRRALDLAGARR